MPEKSGITCNNGGQVSYVKVVRYRPRCWRCGFWGRNKGSIGLEEMTDGLCHFAPMTVCTDENHWCSQGVPKEEFE